MPIESLADALEAIKARYTESAKVRKKFRKYDNTIQLNFLESDKHFQIQINKDQGIDIVEGHDPALKPKVDFESEEALLQILNKDIGAVKAYSSGKVKVDGKISQLLKLKSLMF